MKNLAFQILFIVGLFYYPTIVKAQQYVGGSFGIGASYLTVKDYNPLINSNLTFYTDPKVSLAVGGHWSKVFYQNNKWTAGLRYANIGGCYGIQNYLPQPDHTPTLTLHTLELNTIYSRKLSATDKENPFYGSKYDFFIDIGCYTNYLLYAYWDLNDKYQRNLTNNFKSLDYGLLGGFTVSRALKKNLKVEINFRYQHGIRNINKQARNFYQEGYNRGMMFNFGLQKALR